MNIEYDPKRLEAARLSILERIKEDKRIKALIPEPKCPACHVGVDRPKCLFELGSDCPRHEINDRWLAACRKLDAKQKEAARPSVERSMDCAVL